MSVLCKINNSWEKVSGSRTYSAFPKIDAARVTNLNGTAIYSGYTVPEDGFVTFSFGYFSSRHQMFIYLNGVLALHGWSNINANPQYSAPPGGGFPVKKGDRITSNINIISVYARFFPYKRG